MEAPLSFIRIGTAGWNYKDWYGIFYPEGAGKSFKELDYLAQFFDTVEINSSFYRPPNKHMGWAWVKKVSHNPRFKFTMKLWQRFTHDRKDFTAEDVRQFTEGTDPLFEAGLLGAVLCQFPWSFKNDPESISWLKKIFAAFSSYPLVVELRHGSWESPDVVDFLNQARVGFATIDQPVIGKSLEPKAVQTGPIGYIRLHGRNYKTWFASKPGSESTQDPSSRYDYLYSEGEIQEWSEIVKTVARTTGETYVVQNNHPRGQAVCNALQLKAALGETIGSIPDILVEKFPFLRHLQVPQGSQSDASHSLLP